MSKQKELDSFLEMLPRNTGTSIKLTKAMAELMLEAYIHNRATKPTHVNFLVKEMNAGNWHNTGDPIKFDQNNVTVDGFHRLTAFLKSELTHIDVTIFPGLDREVLSKIDSGIKRSIADFIVLNNIKHANTVSGGVRMIQSIQGGYYTSSTASRLSPAEVLEIVLPKKTMYENVAAEAQRFYGESSGLLTSTQFMALRYLTQEISKEDSDNFFTGFVTGAGLEANSPILTLRNKLGKHKRDKSERKLSNVEIINYFIVAWNKYRAAESVKVLKLPENTSNLKLV